MADCRHPVAWNVGHHVVDPRFTQRYEQRILQFLAYIRHLLRHGQQFDANRAQYQVVKSR